MRNIEAATVQAVMDDFRQAPISEPLRAGLDLAETLTIRPAAFDARDLARWRAAGLDAVAIDDAANVTFHFNLINRLADAFDFPLPNEAQLPRLARALDRAGAIFATARPEIPWVQGEDGCWRPVELEQARSHMLHTAGTSPAELRRAVEAHTAAALGASRPEARLPEALHGYLDKLARHAYRITDEDVQGLKDAGHDEDAVYELTVVGALGAALAPLERLGALLAAPAHVEGRPPASP